MNDTWKKFLNEKNARFEEGKTARFLAPEEEARAALEGNVVADLSHLALIEASGDDATTFLHNQFTNDVRALAPGQRQFDGYCNPKGRLLALFDLVAGEGGYSLALPAEIAEPTLKRLRMFVLMSKVVLEPRADLAHAGLSGPDLEALLRCHGGIALPEPDHAVEHGGMTVVRLPGPHPRVRLFGEAGAVTELCRAIAGEARMVGAPAWRLLDIHAGLPQIHAATVEAFVPQMVNLQAVGGLSFTKGCYPGQEVVARMKYLGKLKRRMYRARISAPAQPGDALFEGETRRGTVVEAAPGPDGATELLAVIEIAAANAPLTLGAPDGAALELLPDEALPYPIET